MSTEKKLKVLVLNGDNLFGLVELPDLTGEDGKSAYECAIESGFSGTIQQWLHSLIGGAGKSAYQIAQDNGFTGSEQQWLDSLKSQPGKSAYELALENGFSGTVTEWLESLKGKDAKPDGPAEPGPGPAGPIVPVFASAGKTGSIIKIGGGDWVLQSPDKDYSIERATNLVGELLRMEVRQGESWKSDANNLSNGVPRERAEAYRQKFPTPYKTDIWISFDLMIEPGADIVYTNKDWFTYLFQWHHAEQQIKTKTGPSFGMTVTGQGTLKLLTSGDARVPLPASAARVERASVDIKRGELVNITFRIKHDPVNGEIDWYVGGQLVYSGKKVPIGYTEDQAGYPKFGIYRSTNKESMVVCFYNPQVLINETLLERTRQKPVLK